ncbi:MAG: glycosyl transferase [Deltaproteobacteria bacterium]|nr:glycosyl transferase [Deltaproteobacteria bacterium]MBW2132948.1 glycosyl transferase [Deltaproteobacteria bacterium]
MAYGLFAAAFFICLVLTPLVRKAALAKGWVAQPSEERWHKKPTALLGGIAIYAGISIPLFVLSDFYSIFSHMDRTAVVKLPASPEAAVWLGITGLFLLGLLDDFIKIKPHTKLMGQIVVASFIAFLGFRLHWFVSLTLDTLVTIVWIVGITNAFNLLDNMDGLCAGVGLVAALILAVLFFDHSGPLFFMTLVLAGSLAAFLVYNFNPASIFMGDSGSLSIGFFLSMLAMLYTQNGTGNRISAYAVPVMVLMVPVLDTTLVTLIRILSGRKASVGGRDHTSHRLVLMGLSERGAALFLYGIGAVSGLSAVFVDRSDTLTSPGVIIPLALSVMLMGIYLAQIRVYPEEEFSLLRGRVYTPILVELTYKRQLLLVVLDFGLIAFAYYVSYRLRFEGNAFLIYFKVFLRSLPAVIACKFLAFFAMGVYRGIWRYMGATDVYTYLKATAAGTVLSVTVVTFIYRFEDFSKGIFVIDWFLCTGLLLGTRGSFRLFRDTMRRKSMAGDAVIIYGAGRGGEILLREILNNDALNVKPVGFIDDDALKAGRKLQGYPILGSFADLETLVEKHPVGGLLVSFTEADPARMEAVKTFCKARGLFLKRFSVQLEDVPLPADERQPTVPSA